MLRLIFPSLPFNTLKIDSSKASTWAEYLSYNASMGKTGLTAPWSLHCLARARVATIASSLVLSSLDLRLVEKVLQRSVTYALRSMDTLARMDPTYDKSW